MQSHQTLGVQAHALSDSLLVIDGVERINVPAFLFRKATELEIVKLTISVLVHVIKHLVDFTFRKLDAQILNTFMELVSLDSLVSIKIKRKEGFVEIMEFLLDFDGDEDHDFGDAFSVVILLKSLENVFLRLESATFIGIEDKIDLLGLVLIPLDFDGQILIGVKQLFVLLSGYAAIGGYFCKEFLLDCLWVDVHEPMTLLLPLSNGNLFLVWVQVEDVSLHSAECSVVHLLLDELDEQLQSRFWNILSVDDRSQVVHRHLVFGGDLSLLSVPMAVHGNFLFVVGHIVDYTFWDRVMSVMVEGLPEKVLLLSCPWHRGPITGVLHLHLTLVRDMVDKHVVGIFNEHPPLRDLFPRQIWLNGSQESFTRVHARLSLKLDDLGSPSSDFVIFNQECGSVVSV